MIRVFDQVDNSVPARTMCDGQVAKVVQWGDCSDYIGRVVQRYDNKLITLGAESLSSWSLAFGGAKPLGDDCRVIILPPGTKLIV